THASLDASLHEMLIVLRRGSYVRPHKHVGKCESFTILEGTADVILFEDDGTVREIVAMGAAGTGRTFHCRISAPLYHTLPLVPADSLLFQEVTEGPFRPEQTLFAPWSPDGRDSAAALGYLTALISN